MKAEIVNRTSKKTGKEYTCLQITIGDWTRLIFLQRYELLYVQKQIELIEKKQLITDKDSVDANLFN